MIKLHQQITCVAIVAVLSVLLTVNATAELRMPAVFGDHMVLQRNAPVPVWGWAEPGQAVRVSLGARTAEAVTQEDGKWVAKLRAMPAGGPFELAVSVDGESVTFDDVMVGEVWICSGQSNMDMRLMKLGEAAEAEADHPNLRLFRVERAIANQPADDLDAGDGWARCEPGVARSFSAAAYFMGRDIMRDLDVPVGLIHTAYGGTPIEAWTATDALAANPETASVLGAWERRVKKYEDQLAAHEAAVAAGESDSKAPADLPVRYSPGGLYNAMLHPLAPYGVRGFAWYQGESNIWRAAQYHPLLTAMITDWREQWGGQKIPFGVVQLPNYANPPRVPRGDYSWPELREAQFKVSNEVHGVGLVVTIDVGDPTDIHPFDKETVGHRLALWAMGEANGKDIVFSGPTFRNAEFVGDKVYLDFDHIAAGLETRDGGKLKGFIIAGPDKKFRWAVAEIEGRRIVVSEKKVPNPQAVRYAWDDDPWWANLINRQGLPASPFRTDDWPGITSGSR